MAVRAVPVPQWCTAWRRRSSRADRSSPEPAACLWCAVITQPPARRWTRRSAAPASPPLLRSQAPRPASAMPVARSATAPAISSDAPAFSSTISRGGARLTVQDVARDASVCRRVATAQGLGRRFRQPDVGRDAHRTCSQRRRGTPRLSCSRSSRSRRGRQRRGRPRRASEPSIPSDRATSSVSSGRGTPTSCRAAPAGFVSGPSRLNAVRTPRSLRVGAA